MSQATGDFWSEQQQRGGNVRQNQQPIHQPLHQPLQRQSIQQQQQPQQPSQRLNNNYPGPFDNIDQNRLQSQAYNYGTPMTHLDQNPRQQRPYNVHYQPQFVDQGRVTVVPVNQTGQRNPPQRSFTNYQQNIRFPGSRFPLTNLPEVSYM